MGRISAGGSITTLYSATALTDSIYGKKKLLRYKVNRPVRFQILSVTLHSPVSWEDEFLSKYFMYNNARGTIAILSPYRKQ